MHLEILDSKQLEIFLKLRAFDSDGFYLVGGTALALQLGHRKSIDLDLFNREDLNIEAIKRKLNKNQIRVDSVLVDSLEGFTFISEGVKVTFLTYLYNIKPSIIDNKFIKILDPLNIASMKVYAIGRRSKWKDYIDLMYLIKGFGFSEIEDHSRKVFGNLFNSKLFREQLVYFKDIDYSEAVNFMPGFEVSDSEVEKFLESVAVL